MATKKNERFLDVMIDLETLDTAASAAILSIGAVKFNVNSLNDEGFYRVVKIQSNIDEHRTISGSTLAWWMKQTPEAQTVFSDPDAIPLGQALEELRTWLGSDAANLRIWANSPDFDCTILAHAYGQQGTPWTFWNTRCFRTVKSMEAARAVPKPENKGAHNALFDAIAQAQHLQAIWAKGIGK